MKFHTIWKNYKNCIMAFLTILVNIAVLSLFFDFYYDLNDDVLMKDIISGVYTGIPDGHNMQTLYILGAFISMWYRLFRGFPWYGLFLFLCQFGGLYLIGIRILRFCSKQFAKVGCLIVLTIFLWGTILGHLLSIQYTVTCAILAATAIFLFMTTEKGLGVRAFVIQNIPSVFLVVLAYQLRTEMLLLVFPLIALAGLYSFAEEERILEKENFLKYGIAIGMILFGMLLSSLIDFAAYGNEEWKEFRDFFRYRTEVYDFHYDILTSGEHSEYLSSIGLSETGQKLLANYNFGLDEEIDAKLLKEIAAYGTERTSGTVSAAEILKTGRYYIYRTLHMQDAPYNLLVLAAYLCVAVFGIWSAALDKTRRGRWYFIWELGLLALVRSFLWMYILIRGRDPVRITHSLYLAELTVLLGLLFRKNLQNKVSFVHETRLGGSWAIWKTGLFTAAFFIGIICLGSLPDSLRAVMADKNTREEANQGCEAIARYCKAHPDNFYFEDVYSTVGFSQKIFQNVDNSMANYDIMGGWICKSPLYREKLEKFGISVAEEGLLRNPNVYFIVEAGTPDSDISWIQDYYEEKGVTVRLEQIDSIEDKYAVIYLRPMQVSDTEKIVSWRNQDRVRHNFVYQELFTAETHMNWIRTQIEPGHVVQFMICEAAGDRAVGSVYLRDIDREKGSAEYGIFIGEEDALDKGYGTQAAKLALSHAFKELKLQTVFLRVFADNISARRSYEKAGFHLLEEKKEEIVTEGVTREMVFYAIEKGAVV